MGRPVEAEADAARALALLLPMLARGQQTALLGNIHLALGQAQAANGKAREAHASFVAAIDQLRPSQGPNHPDVRLAERLSAGPLPSPKH
jgi:hypothetical protein